jgi:AraC-like DNA-binding protein
VEAGFTDQSHLTSSFRREIGVTPGRFRAALD